VRVCVHVNIFVYTAVHRNMASILDCNSC